GFSITRGGSGGYDSAKNNPHHGGQRLNPQLSFTGPESGLSQISEGSESDDVDEETGRHHSSYSNPASSGFVMDWDNSSGAPNSITFSGQPPSKKFRAMDGDIYTCYNGLDTQFSMPQDDVRDGDDGGQVVALYRMTLSRAKFELSVGVPPTLEALRKGKADQNKWEVEEASRSRS
ncbi:unnamed protein product, partial [Linum tenue]